MDVSIKKPPEGGRIRAITAKSAAHRLLICAALADKKTEMICTDVSNDIDATADCLNALGAEIVRTADGFCITPIDRSALPETAVCRCRDSGSTLRFLIPVTAALGVTADFMPEKRLPLRPLSPLYEELERHGIALSRQGSVPFRVSGKLPGGDYGIAANVSSQFISGLLFALPLTGEDFRLKLTEKFESRSYVDLTLDAMKKFGVSVNFENDTFIGKKGSGYTSPGKVIAEGDWSNAAFWLVAGAIGKAPVTVTGLNMDSLQGDKAVLDILKEFGARIEIEQDVCTVYPSKLHGIRINAENIPDLVPVLALAACRAVGETTIYNAERLRIKESDRLFSVCETLNKLGGDVRQTEDGLCIVGTGLSGGVCDSFDDHRIAMTTAVASVCTSGTVTVKNASAVEKSYPKFWEDFERLGGITES